MAKPQAPKTSRNARIVESYSPEESNVNVIKRNNSPIEPKTASQADLVQTIFTHDIIFVSGPAGTGKAQPLDSVVYTPTGPKLMGNVNVGDEILSLAGRQIVTGVFPQGTKDIYTITFEDGRSTECCLDHLWEVYTHEWSRAGDASRVLTTEDVLKYLRMNSYKNRMYIRLPEYVDFNEAELPIDPYLLGVIIGDGHIGNGYYSVTTTDPEIVDEVEKRLPTDMKIGAWNRITFSLINRKKSFKVKNGLYHQLVALGLNNKLSYDKFIPDVYKYSSYSQRLEIVQGLMDTDGTVCKKSGTPSFCSSSMRLAEDMAFMIRSLGGLAKISVKKTTHADAYQVNIRIDSDIPLFRLPRKRLLQRRTQYSQSLRLRIKSIEFSRVSEAQCISVSSDDSLYLTDGFVVTHNTWLTAALAARELDERRISNITVSRPAVEVGGEELGFLPGELDEKFTPWFEPFRDVLEERLGTGALDYHLKRKNIEAKPLGLMRGKSYKDKWIILDEAQNTTPGQMKMFLTRLGEGSKMIILGDVKQSDIKTTSGMSDAIRRLKGVKGIAHHEFTREDIVRHDLVAKIISRYEND